MEFSINEKLFFENGAKLEEIVNTLQKFTNKYLYLEDSKLKGVLNLEEINLNRCHLITINNGYILKEEQTDKYIHVFSVSLARYLLNKETENFRTSLTDSSFSFSSEETSEVVFTEFKSYKDFQDNLEEVEYIKEKKVEYIKEEKKEIEIEKEKVEKVAKEIRERKETHFRILVRNVYDNECLNSSFIDKEKFDALNEGDIDLCETIKYSFSAFLISKGYQNISIKISFFDFKFAEVNIFTSEDISSETISDIEENANLQVTTDEIIFFIHRVEEDPFHSYEVPLSRLEYRFVSLVQEKVKFVPYKNDFYDFYFENSLFSIKNEGDNLYSVFDINSHFYYSHLSPSLYPSTTEYSELPIAQFSL
jgi:hypothetical protein